MHRAAITSLWNVFFNRITEQETHCPSNTMRIYSNGAKKKKKKNLEYYCNIKSDALSIQIALSHSLSTLKHKKQNIKMIPNKTRRSPGQMKLSWSNAQIWQNGSPFKCNSSSFMHVFHINVPYDEDSVQREITVLYIIYKEISGQLCWKRKNGIKNKIILSHFSFGLEQMSWVNVNMLLSNFNTGLVIVENPPHTHYVTNSHVRENIPKMLKLNIPQGNLV